MIQLSDLSPITSPLPWHAREWEKLSAQLRDEQLPHALLLAGGQAISLVVLSLCLRLTGFRLRARSIVASVIPVT